MISETIIVYRKPTPEEIANSTEELPKQEDFKGRLIQFITTSSEKDSNRIVVKAIVTDHDNFIRIIDAELIEVVPIVF